MQQRLAITLAVFISLFSGQAELELSQVTRQCCAWARADTPPLPLLPLPLPLLTMTPHRKLKMFSFECTKRRRDDCCCRLLCAMLLLLFRLLLLLLPEGATLVIFLLLLFAHSFLAFVLLWLFFCTLPQATPLPRSPSLFLSCLLPLYLSLSLPPCAPVNSIWSHLASICSNLTYKLCQIAERSLSLSGFCEQFSLFTFPFPSPSSSPTPSCYSCCCCCCSHSLT